MAAYSTGASWSFPEDLPGSWELVDDAKDYTEQESVENSNSSPTDSSTQPEDQPPQPKRRRKHFPPRQCRICLEVVLPTFHTDASSTTSFATSLNSSSRVTYESADGGRLLSPCKCKGSQKYVHEDCLSAWRRADPLQKRNYWQCPTCSYQYRLERLTWGSWISSTPAQLGLTAAIFFLAVFLLGFIADPIINMYVDPIDTIATAGGPTGSLIFDGEKPSWAEHIAKGFASLGLLGFAKWMLSLAPWQLTSRSGYMFTRGGLGTGRNRAQQINLALILIGIATFIYAVWQGVRTWSRRTLESASERVVDVPGADDEDEDEDENHEGT